MNVDSNNNYYDRLFIVTFIIIPMWCRSAKNRACSVSRMVVIKGDQRWLGIVFVFNLCYSICVLLVSVCVLFV